MTAASDRSRQLLTAQFHARPDETRVVLLTGNFGQHMAILAGFAHVRGEMAITLDADLQNPPEEIPRLVAEVRKGHDYVGTVRGTAPGFGFSPIGLERHEPSA